MADAGVGAGVGVVELFATVTPTLAVPTVLPLPLYPRQTRVCEPFETAPEFQPTEKVNPAEFE
jgi:hypothetical protein